MAGFQAVKKSDLTIIGISAAIQAAARAPTGRITRAIEQFGIGQSGQRHGDRRLAAVSADQHRLADDRAVDQRLHCLGGLR